MARNSSFYKKSGARTHRSLEDKAKIARNAKSDELATVVPMSGQLLAQQLK